MSETSLTIDNVTVPRILYGTAWKEEETQRLTEQALQLGFRGIDTANQRRHYHEAAVGQAIQAQIERGTLSREELFLQTKFTFQHGQDHRVPYDVRAPIPDQVEQSFASSLEHLQTDVIDSYVLHGPMRKSDLTREDWAAWRAMEAIQQSGRILLLGVSNFTLQQLELLLQKANVQPRFVQNRCYASLGWDRDVRELCAANGISYQGFSLLTANRQVLAMPELKRIADRRGRTVNQIIFRFALDVSLIPLTGTTDATHARQDLDVLNFHLDADEIAQIETLAQGQNASAN